jgi:hypothetical protein
MINELLPQRADNAYRGSRIALWLFGLVVLLKLVIGLRSIFDGYAVASSADGIPLDTYTPAGAQAVVSLFASLGLAHVAICLACVLVLIRYRTLVPFMFTLLLLEQLSRKAIGYFLPIARTVAPTRSVVTLVLLTMMIVGLAMSLWRRETPGRP